MILESFQAIRARAVDVPKIADLIGKFAGRGMMLPRSMNDIYDRMANFYVAIIDGNVAGCVSLRPSWTGESVIAEIRSLAIDEPYQRNGVGTSLVKHCLDEAYRLRIPKVFALTYCPIFFVNRCEFMPSNKAELPGGKVWQECINCQHFMRDCGELLVTKKIEGIAI
jgi:amino-acid N-acetyltransferase